MVTLRVKTVRPRYSTGGQAVPYPRLALARIPHKVVRANQFLDNVDVARLRRAQNRDVVTHCACYARQSPASLAVDMDDAPARQQATARAGAG